MSVIWPGRGSLRGGVPGREFDCDPQHADGIKGERVLNELIDGCLPSLEAIGHTGLALETLGQP